MGGGGGDPYHGGGGGGGGNTGHGTIYIYISVLTTAKREDYRALHYDTCHFHFMHVYPVYSCFSMYYCLLYNIYIHTPLVDFSPTVHPKSCLHFE